MNLTKIYKNLNRYFNAIKIIQKVEGTSDRMTQTFERILSSRMTTTYEKIANVTIENAVKIVGKGDDVVSIFDINKIQKNVDSTMNRVFIEKDLILFDKDIARYYIQNKNFNAEKFNLPPEEGTQEIIIKAKKAEISASFEVDDKAIVNGIQKQHRFAAQNLYKQGYSEHVTDAIEKTLKKVGLSRTQAGSELQKQLLKSLGLKPNKVKDIIPPKFKGTNDQYFKGLSATTFNRAQSFNKVQLFKQAGVSTYFIVAVLDNRTSRICVSMNGRMFTIEQGEQLITGILGAESSKDLKSVAGWKRDLTSFGIKDPQAFKTGSKASKFSADLSKAGLALPPYHFRCRTSIRLNDTSFRNILVEDSTISFKMAEQMVSAESAKNVSQMIADAELVKGEFFKFKGQDITITRRFFVKSKNMEYVGFLKSDGSLGKSRIHIFKEQATVVTKGAGPVAFPSGPAPIPVKPVFIPPKKITMLTSPSAPNITNPKSTIKNRRLERNPEDLKKMAKEKFDIDFINVRNTANDKMSNELLNYINDVPILNEIIKKDTVNILRLGSVSKSSVNLNSTVLGFYDQKSRKNIIAITKEGLGKNVKDVLVHELGHSFDKFVRTEKFKLSPLRSLFLKPDPKAFFRAKRQVANQEIWGTGKKVSAYAQTSPSEDFAESFMNYINNNKIFRSQFSDKAKAIDELIKTHLKLDPLK